MAISVPIEQGVAPNSLQLPGAPALGDNGAAETAQGLNIAADQFRQAQVEQQQKRDATMVFDAVNTLADQYRTTEETARARRGAAAHGVTNDVASWWEEEQARVMAGLENETQRELFEREAARRREVSLNSFSTFEANEGNAAVNSASEARKVNAIDLGAANYNDPEGIAAAREEINDAIGVQARMQGWDPDRVAAERTGTLTKLHQQVIENMLDADPEGARAYFETNKDEIAGSAWDALSNKLETADSIVGAQRLSDDIWARGLTRDEALKAARAESEGTEREQALQLLRQQYNEQEQSIAQVNKDKLDAAYERFYGGGGARALTPNDIAFLQSQAPDVLARMRDTRPQDLVETNWRIYDRLIDMYENNRTEFADQLDLRKFEGALNSRELQTLQQLQSDLQSDALSPTATQTQILAEVPWDTGDREERGIFEREVRREVADEQFRLKRQLQGDEVRAIMDRQLMNVTIPRNYMWDKVVPVYQLTPEQRVNLQVEIDEIPDRDRTQIEAALRRANLQVTDQNIVRRFREISGL